MWIPTTEFPGLMAQKALKPVFSFIWFVLCIC